VLLCTGLSNGSVVLYVAGADFDGTDGGGKMRIGVATGPSLEALSLHPEYLIEGTPNTRDERSVFPNGALLLSNGTVAMTYMGQSQVRLGLFPPQVSDGKRSFAKTGSGRTYGKRFQTDRYVCLYTVQNDSWGGVFLITSDCAVGCPWRKHGVVIGCGGDAAHTTGADPQVSELTLIIWPPLQRALR